MAKDAYYFSHDYDPTGDPKIAAMIGEHGGCGYGVFWRLIEMLHSDDSHRLPLKKYLFIAIAKQMLSDATTIENFIKSCIDDYELFNTDGITFWSARVERNIGKKDDLKQKRQEAGRIGGQNKAMANKIVANAKQVLPIAKQNVAKEIKEKEIKLNENLLNSLEDDIFNSKPNLKKAFDAFVKMRAKIKKPLIDDASDLIKKKVWKLANQSEQDAIEILNNSVMNSYQGVFQLTKDNNNNKHENNTTIPATRSKFKF